ncbi:hypothetical protein ABZ923_40100 [Streptomyces sp. NPDC046881]|uniref:hypothetical protein n=1 Tax=Streptomyces sp. NPDC046881 TaxID=3155374 RepID=UPI003408E197
MTVDLTKKTTPAPEGAAVDKEPVALTAREELMLPLRAFAAAVGAGSVVLGRWIAGAVWQGVRTASRPQGSGGTASEGEEEAPASKGGIGDTIEQLVLGVFVVVIACTLLSGVVGALWAYAASYAVWVVLGLVVAWCLLAAAFAPAPDPEDEEEEEDDTTENDHEKSAGEKPQEGAEEGGRGEDDEAREARWSDAREKLRQFVEQRVAAGAANRNPNVKGRGARIDDLLAEQQQHGALPGMTRKGMIELLETAGITVREQMSFRVFEESASGSKWVKKNVPGVHVDDLTRDLGYRPRLPAHLVPDLTPGASPVLGPESAPDPAPIPAARTAGE